LPFGGCTAANYWPCVMEALSSSGKSWLICSYDRFLARSVALPLKYLAAGRVSHKPCSRGYTESAGHRRFEISSIPSMPETWVVTSLNPAGARVALGRKWASSSRGATSSQLETVFCCRAWSCAALSIHGQQLYSPSHSF
jgi:hypothetical protein